MSTFNDHEFYQLIGKLNFLSKVKVGDKISLTSSLITPPDLWYGPILRYFLDENRKKLIKEMKEMHASICIVNKKLLTITLDETRRYYTRLFYQNLDLALVGLRNLLKTYENDSNVYGDLKSIVDNIDFIIMRLAIERSANTSSPINIPSPHLVQEPASRSAPGSIFSRDLLGQGKNEGGDKKDNNDDINTTLYYTTESNVSLS